MDARFHTAVLRREEAISRTSIRALLIEDDPDDVQLVAGYLAGSKALSVELERAAGLSEGLTQLDHQAFDVVLTDLNLPDGDGLATFHALHTACPDVPVIVLTGIDSEALALQAVKSGAEDYLCKTGLERAALLRAIRYAVERARHRALEARLNEEEVLYRILFDHSPDGVLLLDPQTLLPQEFNPTACRQLGYAPDEFRGVPMSAHDAEQTADEIRARIQQVQEGGRVDFETRHRGKDGELLEVIVTMQPIMLAGRCLVHCIVRNATQWKRAEQSLRESEQRYRRLLGAVTTYRYTVWLNDGTPVSTEHSLGCVRATGYTPEEYRADPYLWITMVPPEDRERVQRYAADVHAGHEVVPLEHRIVHRDGSVHWVRNTIVPHRDGGQLVRYDGLVEDITERKLAQQALLERDAHILAAQQIQSRILPTASPRIAGFDIAGASCPAAVAEGDYFNYLALLDGGLAVVVGDVSGHGLGPAMLMAMTHAHLQSLVRVYSEVPHILGHTNSFLLNESDYFVTLMFLCIDPLTRIIRYVSAGHPTGYVFDAEGSIKARLESTTLPLAVLPDIDFPEGEPVALASGDMVLLLTDGLMEARSPCGAFYGAERVCAFVRSHRHCDAARIVTGLQEAVLQFIGGCRQQDDATAVVVKVL